jgi:hypothetical protein
LSAKGSAEKERKKKVRVALPREVEMEDGGEGAGRKRSSMARRPLDEDAKRRKVDKMEKDAMDSGMLESDELVSRAQHFDEEKQPALPETIEIYLPGKSAWDDVREQIGDDLFARFGYSVSLCLPPRIY